MGWKSGKVFPSPNGGWSYNLRLWGQGGGGGAEIRLEKGYKKGSLRRECLRKPDSRRQTIRQFKR